MTSKYHIPVLFLFASTLFLINLGGFDLWPPDEPRYAQIAREMVNSGDFLVPRVNGDSYKEKPPLLFWMQSVSAVPFGDVTEWPARLPSALSGIVTVLLTYLLVRRLFDPRTAFWAGLILITTQKFWWQTRFGQIDMLLTACVTTSFYFFWLWHKDHRRLYLLAFYLSIAAGVFAKGPPALIFPLLMAFTFYWKKWGQLRSLHLVSGIVLVGFLIALWLIPARLAITGESALLAGDGIAENLVRQTIGRFVLGVSHANPPWYYLFQLPVDLFPWSLFLPWLVLWVRNNRKSTEEMSFLLSWVVPALIFFSICVGKRALYLLPLYPAFSAMLALSILDLMDGPRLVWRKRTGFVWSLILFLIGLVPIGGLGTEFGSYWNNWLIVLIAAVWACSAYSLWSTVRSESRRLPMTLVWQYSLLLIFVATIGFPLANEHKSAKDFCEPMRQLSRADIEFDLYSFAFSREEYIYYSEHFHETVPDGLLNVPGLETMSQADQVRLQGKALRTIQKAVDSVDIERIEEMGEDKRKLLRETLTESILELNKEQPGVQLFEDAMIEYVEELQEKLTADKPVFLITQEQDWRWFLALAPTSGNLHIIKNEYVGSRHVLLVANSSGYDQYNSHVRRR